MRTVLICYDLLLNMFLLIRSTFITWTRQLAAHAALGTLAGLSFPASAFHPLITDDKGTQGSGGNQLEFSFNEDRATAAGNIGHLRTLPLVYTRGLTEALDVVAGFSHARIRSGSGAGGASGAGNPSIGAKWRFYESEKHKIGFALKPEVYFPVSAERESAGLGTGKTSGNLTLIVTQETAFGAIHVNAGAGRERYRDTLHNTAITRASIAPVWDVSDQWKLALDLGTQSAHAGGARVRSNFAEFGAIYSPRSDLDFALGILRFSDNDRPRTTTHKATAGITWRFR